MSIDDCIDPNHFSVVNGVVAPRPWMQWRHVATGHSPSGGANDKSSGNYPPTGGGPRMVEAHRVAAQWRNNTPLPQHVYGIVTRGGCRVTLQASTQAFIRVATGWLINNTGDEQITTVSSSIMGHFMEAGSGDSGFLNLILGAGGVEFCVTEIHQPSVSFELSPLDANGWPIVQPGQYYTGGAVVTFEAPIWEDRPVSGGSSGSESSFMTGETRIDLFAVPALV